jgi:cytochrome c5
MRMNVMAQRLAIAAVVVAAAILVACGGLPSPEGTQPPTEAQPTRPSQETQPTAAPPAGDGAALLEERCTVCHSLDRVTSASKTRQEWEQTVTRMVGKGARLNADEQEILISYLTETYGP